MAVWFEQIEGNKIANKQFLKKKKKNYNFDTP